MGSSWGKMAVRIFSKADFIAENLFRFCVVPDSGKKLRETGSIAPARSLKSKVCRAAFEWAAKVKSKTKFFTVAACRLAVKRLTKMDGVEVPSIPTLPEELWVEQQAKIICHLCQRSRRNSGSHWRFPGYRQSCSMDWQETVPLEARLFVVVVVVV